MTSIPAPRTNPLLATAVSPQALSKGRSALLLSLALFFALSAYYFVGFEEGIVSVFGNSMVVHEFVHDARHLLGFPCH